MNFNYTFPAVRGKQANSEYYICMIPCGLLSRIFIVDSNDILPEFRAQRKVNYSRIPDIKKYILANRDSYVFSALAASIDGEFLFKEMDNGVGLLEVSMNSTFLINDGQHRKTAIEEAILEDSSLANETIPVVFFKDKGLVRSQQMFTDLNKHAVNTSKSLNTLYDSSNDVAMVTKNTVDKIPFFKNYTDKEKDTIGKFSQKLFTLNNFYNANLKLLGSYELNQDIINFIHDFWNLLSNSITEWQDLINHQVTKKSLREDYIVTQGVVLLAFGKLGNFFLKNKKYDFNIYLPKLKKVNWLRSNDQWTNRTIINGRIVRKEENITLTCNQIKILIGVSLNEKEIALENKIKNL